MWGLGSKTGSSGRATGLFTYTLASLFLLPLKFIILAIFVSFSFKSLSPAIDMAVTRSTDNPFLQTIRQLYLCMNIHRICLLRIEHQRLKKTPIEASVCGQFTTALPCSIQWEMETKLTFNISLLQRLYHQQCDDFSHVSSSTTTKKQKKMNISSF